jgi:hypothetical protein
MSAKINRSHLQRDKLHQSSKTTPPFETWKNLTVRLILRFNLRRKLERLLQRSTNDAPYVIVHRLHDQDQLPIDFELRQYQGLLFCNLIREKNTSCLISYWREERLFCLNSNAFIKSTGAEELAQSAGYLTRHLGDKRRWWRSPAVWTAIVTVSAIVGAFAALWQQGEQLLETPDASVEFADDNPVDVLTGEVSRYKYSFTNQERFTSIATTVTASVDALGRTGGARHFDRTSKIDAGTSKAFAFSETVRLRGTGEVVPAPVTYQLHVEALARAGVMRGARNFLFDSPGFRVWWPLAATKPSFKYLAPGLCSVGGILYSGRDQSVKSTITVVLPVEIQSVVTGINSESETDFRFSRHRTVAVQEFTIPHVQKFRQMSYTLNVRARNARDMDQGMCQTLVDGGTSVIFEEGTSQK